MGLVSQMPPRWFDWDQAINQHGLRLPHVSQRGCIYFVTSRLADSIPTERLRAWKAGRDAWLQSNPRPHTIQQEQALRLMYSSRIERYLDAGHGAALLRQEIVQGIVKDVLGHDDGHEYSLGDFVVMPNHIHALVQTGLGIKHLGNQWQRVSAHKINKALGREGAVWQEEPFDHVVRNEELLRKCQRYIHNNPARLAPGMYLLGKGLAQWA